MGMLLVAAMLKPGGGRVRRCCLEDLEDALALGCLRPSDGSTGGGLSVGFHRGCRWCQVAERGASLPIRSRWHCGHERRRRICSRVKWPPKAGQ